MSNELIVCDTPEQIEMFRLLSMRSALRLEMFGMGRKGKSMATIIKSQFGWKGKNKELMKQLEDHIESGGFKLGKRYSEVV
jgi:hypothetical protein